MSGEQLSDSERARRMSATGRGRCPKVWPRPIYGGEFTQCQWNMRSNLQPAPRRGVMFDGVKRDVMTLVLEAASGVAIHDEWNVEPFDCGDSTCVNHHHWRVVRSANSVAPEMPVHPGFIQLGANEIAEIERILTDRRDPDEPTRIIHRSHPERMYALIDKARMNLPELQKDGRALPSDSDNPAKNFPGSMSNGHCRSPPE